MSRGSANDRELTGEPGELLTVEQAANYLGFESRTIGRWGQNGRLARGESGAERRAVPACRPRRVRPPPHAEGGGRPSVAGPTSVVGAASSSSLASIARPSDDVLDDVVSVFLKGEGPSYGPFAPKPPLMRPDVAGLVIDEREVASKLI